MEIENKPKKNRPRKKAPATAKIANQAIPSADAESKVTEIGVTESLELLDLHEVGETCMICTNEIEWFSVGKCLFTLSNP
jgi:hypothetical protein